MLNTARDATEERIVADLAHRLSRLYIEFSPHCRKAWQEWEKWDNPYVERPIISKVNDWLRTELTIGVSPLPDGLTLDLSGVGRGYHTDDNGIYHWEENGTRVTAQGREGKVYRFHLDKPSQLTIQYKVPGFFGLGQRTRKETVLTFFW